MAVQRVLTQALLHVNTAVRLRPRQVAWRLRYGFRRLRGFRPPPMPKEAPAFDRACLQRLRALMTHWAHWAPPVPSRLDDLREGRFTFAGETAVARGAPPWDATERSRLWRYEIQYCAFVRDLALAHLLSPREEDRDRVSRWLHDWLAHHPPDAGAAWAAYPTAARLMNWALAESVFAFDDPGIRLSYARQAAHLSRSLEWDIDGNHLLQNAAGLTVAGALLGDPIEARGAAVLDEVLSAQVLRDGGHVERCPMYHARALLDVTVARAASLNGTAWDPRLAEMAGFLRSILHDDGDLPQFGDSARGEYPPALAVAALADGEAGTTACLAAVTQAASGIHVLTAKNNPFRVIVRASAPGPAWQPGHAHGDALSYELSLRGVRVVVDTGVHGYDGSPLRDYCRSTAAHNTVQVGGIEQMRFWKTFRAAQRYVLEDGRLEETGGETRFVGCCKVVAWYRHVRDIRLSAEAAGRLVVRDSLSGRLSGQTVRSYVHLHPAWRAAADGLAAVVSDGDVTLRFAAEGEGVGWEIRRGAMPPAWIPKWRGASRVREEFVASAEGWYCEAFGKVEPTDVLVLEGRASADATTFDMGYTVTVCAEGAS